MKPTSAGNALSVFVASYVWYVSLLHIMLTLKTCFLNLKHNLEVFCMISCSPQTMPVNRITSNGDVNVEYASEACKSMPYFSYSLDDWRYIACSLHQLLEELRPLPKCSVVEGKR